MMETLDYGESCKPSGHRKQNQKRRLLENSDEVKKPYRTLCR